MNVGGLVLWNSVTPVSPTAVPEGHKPGRTIAYENCFTYYDKDGFITEDELTPGRKDLKPFFVNEDTRTFTADQDYTALKFYSTI